MLEARIAGEEDHSALADLTIRRMSSKQAELQQAVEGWMRSRHRSLLIQHLSNIDLLDE